MTKRLLIGRDVQLKDLSELDEEGIKRFEARLAHLERAEPTESQRLAIERSIARVRAAKEAHERSETVDQFNRTCPVGTWVAVVRDDGSILETKTRSEAWLVGDGTPVVMVFGISGGYLLDRVTPNRGCDCGGEATGAFSVKHRRGCILPGPHNDPRKAP